MSDKVIDLMAFGAQYRAAMLEKDELISRLSNENEELQNKLATLKSVNDMLQLQLLDLIQTQKANIKTSEQAIANLTDMLQRIK